MEKQVVDLAPVTVDDWTDDFGAYNIDCLGATFADDYNLDRQQLATALHAWYVATQEMRHITRLYFSWLSVVQQEIDLLHKQHESANRASEMIERLTRKRNEVERNQ